MEKSKGHLTFTSDGEFEFYECAGEVFRAPTGTGNVFENGYRFGRWECDKAHFERFREVIVW